MSSSDIAIKVQNLSKVYQKKNSDGELEDFYALKDVNFEIKKGEVIGIIGKNGSGKSTLLKILSGVTKPTTGSVEINGTVASILDVGTGFHQDLSGRENVYLRGKLLGMTTKEIDEVFDDIVDFSEIGEFIDTAVKNYSSGMFLRLAFSIIIHLKCDILLLDEVMSVGDEKFQNKSLIKLNRAVKSGYKTILLISHNLNFITQVSKKALALNKGLAMFYNESIAAITAYQIGNKKYKPNKSSRFVALNKTTINGLSENIKIDKKAPLEITFIYEIFEDLNFSVEVFFIIKDVYNNPLVGYTFAMDEKYILLNAKKNKMSCSYTFDNIFNNGSYFIDIFFIKNREEVFYSTENVKTFEIYSKTKSYEVFQRGKHPLTTPHVQWTNNKV